jgi:3'-phosphoadenosine 5'-phosphosulfate sulfotransferase (PAPS reductase)/FAD synthetase
MQHNDDFLTKWEHIVKDVNKTDVPLECIKKVIIKFHGGKQQTVNLHTLQKQGLSLADIEVLLNRTFHERNDEIRDVDFVVDVNSVAELIQPETDKLLGKL